MMNPRFLHKPSIAKTYILQAVIRKMHLNSYSVKMNVMNYYNYKMCSPSAMQ